MLKAFGQEIDSRTMACAFAQEIPQRLQLCRNSLNWPGTNKLADPRNAANQWPGTFATPTANSLDRSQRALHIMPLARCQGGHGAKRCGVMSR